MKKSYLMLAAAALFAACSSNDLVEEKSPQTTQPTDEQAIVFDSYVNRGTTRAGTAGSIDNDAIKTGTHKDDGFGVFGFYTDNGTYSKYSIPDFMYNQQVTYSSSSSSWTYSPIKYWPNEFGTGAVSDHADHVSFFAYAPYVDVNPANGIPTGDKTKNITRLTSNDATGDPFIKYVVDSDPSTSVDLLWGVAPAASTYSTVTGPTASTVNEGLPYIDLLKAQVNSKVNFNLKHALAKLNITIDAFVDGTDNTKPLDANTRIFVRSITISGFAMKGALNLNNSVKNKPSWYDYDGIKPIATSSEAEAVTFYDGRRDGREAADDGAQGNEKPLGLNIDLIQNNKVFNTSVTPVVYATASASHSDVPFVPSGVTNTTKNLFETTGAATNPIYVIPTEANMDVTIVYDVETIDNNLTTVLSDGVTHGSTIENRIYKTNVFGSAIEAGKAYTLKLHLGMTSVKFDAEVTDWDTTTAASDTDLPHNSPVTVAATSSGATKDINVAADEISSVFSVTGFGSSEALTITPTTVTSDPTGSTTADASGAVKITASYAANTTVLNKTAGKVAVVGSPNSATITIKQAAAPIGLTVTTLSDSQKSVIELGQTATGGDWTAVTVTMTKDGSDFSAFTWDSSTKKITLSSPAANGEDYTVTVSGLGDAEAETKTVNNTIS